MVATLRLDLEYDGEDFAGWAIQPNRRTVEGVFREALAGLLSGNVSNLRVAGRTDAGVSATGQVVSCDVAGPVDPDRLLRGLNGLLPLDVAVRRVQIAPAGFDARNDAVSRAYEYRVLPGLRSPVRRRRVLHVSHPLDLPRLHDATAAIVGQHDFRAFTPVQTKHVFFERTILRAAWETRGDELVFTIAANAFLRHMVRSLVGSLLWVGRGHWEPQQFLQLLSGAQRPQAGPTAPAHPLTLVAVDYSGGAATGERR